MIKNENYKDQTFKDIDIKEPEKIKEPEIKENKKSKIIASVKEVVCSLLFAIILYFVITNFFAFQAYIPSESMNPLLVTGDRAIVTKIYNYNNIKRGDILVFKNSELNDVLIKRVIGLPGDTVTILNGVVSVNGEVIDETYVKNKDFSQNKDGTYNVPEGNYFFLGDNRPVSNDSPLWVNKYINKSDILGKAQVKIYPFNKIGMLK